MSDQEQNDHAWFRERIAVALASGLDAAEQVRFDDHASQCPACAAELSASREMEKQMSGLFALPTPGLEDRIIDSLRVVRRGWNPNFQLHPAVRRAATAVAAVIVLAGFGYVADQQIERAEAPRTQVASNLRSIDQSILLYSNDTKSPYPRRVAGSMNMAGGSETNSGGKDLQFRGTNGYSAAPSTNGPYDANDSILLPSDTKSATAFGRKPTIIEGDAISKSVQNGDAGAAPQYNKQTPWVARFNNWGNVNNKASDGYNPSAGKTLPSDQTASAESLAMQSAAPAAVPPSGSKSSADDASLRGRKSGTYVFGDLENQALPRDGQAATPTQNQKGGGGDFGSQILHYRIRGAENAPSGISGIVDSKNGRDATVDVDGDVGRLHRYGVPGGKSDYFKPGQLAGDSRKDEPTLRTGFQESNADQSVQPAAPTKGLGAVRGAGSGLQAIVPAQTAPEGVALADNLLGGAPAPAPAPALQAPEPPREAAAPNRKIIRNGQMEFEVDRFDAAFAQVSKLTTESNGYIGTTDSEKLPNGKVKGTMTVRVPPERLDTLVLQLRGIGDLKSQKLDANDITKQYTDLESGLRAAKAMEERLLAIIKEGKGQIKDLLAAEKELGVWREKIEHIVGEMRYFDNQVAMSTLQITLFERDIRTPATAQETENIDAGVEASDVETARADALKAIEEAKGRVIQSDLKRYDAGQFGATIVAEVPPDAAGPLLDRLKQIGKMARLDIQRKQTSDPNANSTAPVRVEKKQTRLNLSLYNLANVAPRISSTLNLAAEDVEKAYRAILDRVTKGGGRIVSSNLARNKPDQTTGVINFEVPSSDADAVVAELRGMGELMKMTVTDNPDVNNVTSAKRGYVLQIAAVAAIAPRESRYVQLAAAGVAAAREKILSAASAGGARVLSSRLDENDRNNPSAVIELDVPRAALAAVEKTVADAGDTVSRSAQRSPDSENTLDTKVRLQISLMSADKLPPREVTSLTIEMNDVDGAMKELQDAVQQAGGRIVESNLSKERDGGTRGTLTFEAPLDKAPALVDQARKEGTVRVQQASKNLQVPAGTHAKSQVALSLVTPDTLVEPGTGPLASIRDALATSAKALLLSLRLIVVGLCTVVPFVLIVWGGWKLIKRRKSTSA